MGASGSWGPHGGGRDEEEEEEAGPSNNPAFVGCLMMDGNTAFIAKIENE